MAKPGHLEFNYIYVVQSLGPDEPATGLSRPVRDEAVRRRMRGSGLDFGAKVVDIEAAADLYAFLKRVRADVETTGRRRSSTSRSTARPTRRASCCARRNSCRGHHFWNLSPRSTARPATTSFSRSRCVTGTWLGSILRASRPAPFWALIGPSTSEHPIVLFPAFEAFYSTLLDELDGGKAVADLLETVRAKSATHSLSVLQGERMFTRAFRQYVEEKCNPDAIAQRVAAIIAEGKQRAGVQGATIPSDGSASRPEIDRRNRERNWPIGAHMKLNAHPIALLLTWTWRVPAAFDPCPLRGALWCFALERADELEFALRALAEANGLDERVASS